MSKIGFILPIYNEAKNIPVLYEKIKEAVSLMHCSYEMLFINDASKDDSLRILMELSQNDVHVKVIDFSRNFGHEIAVKAGLDHIQGDYIVIMDTDLQDPPEIIPEMFHKLIEGFDIVYAKRKSRNDGRFKDSTANFFYSFINSLSDTEIPKDTGNFRIFTKVVLESIKKLDEQSRFIRGLFARIGFKQTSIEFDRQDRLYGKTGYPLTKMIKLSLDAIFSFSDLPLRLSALMGFIFAIIGFLGGLYFVILKLIDPEHYIFGITTLLVLMFFFGGIQLIMLGIIGEYIGRIYKEAKNRPLYIIRTKIN